MRVPSLPGSPGITSLVTRKTVTFPFVLYAYEVEITDPGCMRRAAEGSIWTKAKRSKNMLMKTA
jgi:hypothetical protein